MGGRCEGRVAGLRRSCDLMEFGKRAEKGNDPPRRSQRALRKALRKALRRNVHHWQPKVFRRAISGSHIGENACLQRRFIGANAPPTNSTFSNPCTSGLSRNSARNLFSNSVSSVLLAERAPVFSVVRLSGPLKVGEPATRGAAGRGALPPGPILRRPPKWEPTPSRRHPQRALTSGGYGAAGRSAPSR